MPCNAVKITNCLYALTPFLAWFGFFFIKVVFSARIKCTLLNIQFLLIPQLQKKISTVINLKIVFAIYFNKCLSTMRGWDTQLSYRTELWISPRKCGELPLIGISWKYAKGIKLQLSYLLQIPASQQNRKAGFAILYQTWGPPDLISLPRWIFSWLERHWLCSNPPVTHIKQTCIIKISQALSTAPTGCLCTQENYSELMFGWKGEYTEQTFLP